MRSRSESASFADAAASTRSSHLDPMEDIALGGSAEKAFRPSLLTLLVWSLDFLLSCFGKRAVCESEGLVREGLRGLGLWNGGSVVERPGGELAMMDGRSSLGRGDWNGGNLSCGKGLCKGGSSIEEFIPCLAGSVSYVEYLADFFPTITLSGFTNSI